MDTSRAVGGRVQSVSPCLKHLGSAPRVVERDVARGSPCEGPGGGALPH